MIFKIGILLILTLVSLPPLTLLFIEVNPSFDSYNLLNFSIYLFYSFILIYSYYLSYRLIKVPKNFGTIVIKKNHLLLILLPLYVIAFFISRKYSTFMFAALFIPAASKYLWEKKNKLMGLFLFIFSLASCILVSRTTTFLLLAILISLNSSILIEALSKLFRSFISLKINTYSINFLSKISFLVIFLIPLLFGFFTAFIRPIIQSKASLSQVESNMDFYLGSVAKLNDLQFIGNDFLRIFYKTIVVYFAKQFLQVQATIGFCLENLDSNLFLHISNFSNIGLRIVEFLGGSDYYQTARNSLDYFIFLQQEFDAHFIQEWPGWLQQQIGFGGLIGGLVSIVFQGTILGMIAKKGSDLRISSFNRDLWIAILALSIILGFLGNLLRSPFVTYPIIFLFAFNVKLVIFDKKSKYL